MSEAWRARWRIKAHGEPVHITDLHNPATGDRVGYAVKGNASWTVTVAGHQFTAASRRAALVGLDAALTALEVP